MDGGAWWAAVHGVARSRTRLSDFTLFFHFHALEKEMATHSSVLAWRIPGTGDPGGLPSLGSHRVGTRLKRLSSSSSRIFIGRTDAEAEAPILWPLDMKSQLIGKTLMLRKIEGRRMGVSEDEVVEWHH